MNSSFEHLCPSPFFPLFVFILVAVSEEIGPAWSQVPPTFGGPDPAAANGFRLLKLGYTQQCPQDGNVELDGNCQGHRPGNNISAFLLKSVIGLFGESIEAKPEFKGTEMSVCLCFVHWAVWARRFGVVAWGCMCRSTFIALQVEENVEQTYSNLLYTGARPPPSPVLRR